MKQREERRERTERKHVSEHPQPCFSHAHTDLPSPCRLSIRLPGLSIPSPPP